MNKKMRIFRLLASHSIFLFKLNKSGFDECYQSTIKWGFEKSKSQYFQGFAGPHIHFLLIPTLFRLTLNKAEKCFFSAEYVANLNNFSAIFSVK